MSKLVIIVGGGVAGIAAAVALSDSGHKVHLIEKRPMLGGRASSFVDATTDELLDECQHGTMRCCTKLAQLLERLGTHDLIRYHKTLEFIDSDGVLSTLTNCLLPAPAHVGPSFLAFKSLSWRDKLCIGKAMVAILRTPFNEALDAKSVAQWLNELGQTERAINRFWYPILVSACNEKLDRISCLNAFKVFRDGFLATNDGYQFGIPRVPLAKLFEPARGIIEAAGGIVQTRTIVNGFAIENGKLIGVLMPDNTLLEADAVISALQFDLLLKCLPEEVRLQPPFAQLNQIELAPLCGIHLWFDRPVDCPEAIAVLDRNIEWIFNKTLNWDMPFGTNTYLSIVISASQKWAATPHQELVDMALREVIACLPQFADATLVRSRVIRWPKATISPMPGIEQLRPAQRTSIPGFYLAGEWTKTGWPSTMEGAARSGYLAAEAVASRFQTF